MTTWYGKLLESYWVKRRDETSDYKLMSPQIFIFLSVFIRTIAIRVGRVLYLLLKIPAKSGFEIHMVAFSTELMSQPQVNVTMKGEGS